ncbi:hypothetical protein CDD81_5413 [Ophiocordyceps australis]|uniref:Uncharacterized protein n=1 Tax=Ophiocordyceps australis TaxID=1399860 RepID=A0A2C5Y827_9HYPO|nr:hypothetical protein CDD81_5413 [Ophiocordyceps australis]
MSGQVSPQADIPQAIALLGKLTPILRALSADNVSPLAVCQLEKIGRSFLISGPLAKRMPDLLARSGSVRLHRLQALVGWMAGDTAATLAETAGGQAAALLTVCLVDMFCRNSTGHLLHDLSFKLLGPDDCVASMAQLSDLADIIANKLRPLAFGSHLISCIGDIHRAYDAMGITVPLETMMSLRDQLDVERMVELLDGVQLALRDENVFVLINGFRGLGSIVALLAALCPDDLQVLVEGNVHIDSSRPSVIVSLVHDTQETKINVEQVLRDCKTTRPLPVLFRPNDAQTHLERLSTFDRLSLSTEGCLATMVQDQLSKVSRGSTTAAMASFVDLIAAIMWSFMGTDFDANLSRFPRHGLRTMLGPDARDRIVDKLGLYFGVVVPLINLDPDAAYDNFSRSMSELVSDSIGSCSQCLGPRIWDIPPASHPHCTIRRVQESLQELLGRAVLLCFVDTHLDTLYMVQRFKNKLGPHLCRRLLVRAGVLEHSDEMTYPVSQLHADLCQLMAAEPSNAGPGQNIIATTSGSTCMLPAALLKPMSDPGHMVRYLLLDGQFHDHRAYYKALIEEVNIPPRCLAEQSINGAPQPMVQSQLGIHQGMTLSLRPFHNSLAVRAMIRVSGRIIHMSFYDAHLAYMATSVAASCGDHPDELFVPDVVATSVEAPAASDGRLSIVLSHDNVESQFLASVEGVPCLFQGSSCLGCMMLDARENGFQLLIQS